MASTFKEISDELTLSEFYEFVLNCSRNEFYYDRTKNHLYKITRVNSQTNTYVRTFYDCKSPLDIKVILFKDEVLDILKSYIRSEKIHKILKK